MQDIKIEIFFKRLRELAEIEIKDSKHVVDILARLNKLQEVFILGSELGISAMKVRKMLDDSKPDSIVKVG